MKRRTFTSLLSLAGAWAGNAYSAPPGQPLSVGIVPQQSPGELTRLWTPVLRYLEEKSGIPLQFETAKDITTFHKRTLAGEYDILYTNPLTYAMVLHTRLGYEAFARERDRSLVGLLVVRKDSRYQTLQDLSGSQLAFPAEAAMAASIIPRALLDKQGVAYTPHYVGSHDSVYLSVEKGLYAGGGGIARVMAMQPASVKDQLRVLWSSPAYPPHPFAAHPKVSASVVRSLQTALIAMNQESAGLAVLKPLDLNGFMATRDADYESLRSLGYKVSEF